MLLDQVLERGKGKEISLIKNGLDLCNKMIIYSGKSEVACMLSGRHRKTGNDSSQVTVIAFTGPAGNEWKRENENSLCFA